MKLYGDDAPSAESYFWAQETGHYLAISYGRTIRNGDTNDYNIAYKSPYSYMTCNVTLWVESDSQYTGYNVEGIWWPNGL